LLHDIPKTECTQDEKKPDTSNQVLNSQNHAKTTDDLSSRKTVDCVLMGKGGCGKSLIASLIAQQIRADGEYVFCIDADPINNTLAGIEALEARVVDLLEDETTLNVAMMDNLISEIIGSKGNWVIDPGASGFLPFLSYMLRDDLFNLMAENGKKVRVHAVIVGGDALVDTASALGDMLRQLPACVQLVVWLNSFYGPLTEDGNSFEESAFWRKEAAPFCTVVRMPELSTTSLQSFRKMVSARRTFSWAASDPSVNPVEKQRLARIWAPLRAQIAATR
jgi:CobQ/CobB/MinD/ParA nucleotide binding domain